MKQQPAQVTRRDWFRLRTNPVGQLLDSPVSENQAGLQPIAHPENHDGLDLTLLPPMREALLTPAQVGSLFEDINVLASDVQLMQRSIELRQKATTLPVSTQLAVARDSLLTGQIPRLQIRYRWQEALWIDTLERRSDGVRLVRIQHLSSTPT